MNGVLAAADACIAILKPVEMYRTVYPNKVFDYMAAGRPVILAIDGVIREVVESAEGGVVVPPGDADALGDAIRKLEKNPQNGRILGSNGRKYIENHFDRVILAEKFMLILERMLENR
jgi:glycosyltransferase involved in cell wall biosynthesis